jgi:hypothetical protein
MAFVSPSWRAIENQRLVGIEGEEHALRGDKARGVKHAVVEGRDATGPPAKSECIRLAQ